VHGAFPGWLRISHKDPFPSFPFEFDEAVYSLLSAASRSRIFRIKSPQRQGTLFSALYRRRLLTSGIDLA
jgi:hypothetical protein